MSTKTKAALFVWLLIFILPNRAFTQNTPLGNVSIASPTAASLGKYADIPVHYHTGIPEINIPIYTVKEGPLQLPISLSYHASGLKVMEQASWVGAGWALNAGGVITRTVIGAPDDRGLSAAATDYGHFWNYGYNNYLYASGGSGCAGAPGCPVGAPRNADDVGIADGHKDGEPDLYFFNFGNYSGKFYFRDDRTPVLVPQQDFKITPIFVDGPTVSTLGMEGFVITTPDGVKYYFGKNQTEDGNIDAIEITTSINTKTSSITNQGAVSSWFLNRVVSADDEFSINLIYAHEKSSYYTLEMFPIWNVDATNTFFNSTAVHEYDLAKNFVNGVRLSRIEFSNGTVRFNPGAVRTDLGDYASMVLSDVANTEATTLGSISISDNNGFCKKDSFSYSYFVDNTNAKNGYYTSDYPATAGIESDKYRLRLDSLQEMTCNGYYDALPPHKFSYYSELVPRKLSFGQDHWGFYNGIGTNETLVPSYKLNNGPVEGADRDAHWPAMRGGSLSRIEYPTGGYTQFDYEAHDTYGTITTYATEQLLSLGAGYVESMPSNTTTAVFTGNAYQITIQNTDAGGLGRLDIYDDEDNLVQSLSANTNESKTGEWFSIGAGTYRVVLSKSPFGGSGKGVFASISQYIPTTTTGNILVGGLRIKTITHNDGVTSADMVTNYSYKPAGSAQSSGILYSRPVYVSILRNDVLKKASSVAVAGSCTVNGCTACDGSSIFPYFKSGSPIMPLGTTQGNHIGYDEVVVSQTNNGFSVYRYYGSDIWSNIGSDIVTRSINTTGCTTDIPNFPAAPLPFEFMRGELKYEGHFNQAGIAIKENYYYPVYLPDPVKTPAYKVSLIGGSSNWMWGTEYELQSARKHVDKVISFDTDPATGTYVTNTSITYYRSAFHNQPTRKVQTTSGGDSLATDMKYAFDFRIPACDAIVDGNIAYTTAVAAADAAYSLTFSCTPSSFPNCHWMGYQQYRYDKAVARQAYVVWQRAKFTDDVNLFATNHLTAKTAADAELKPILELQDEYANNIIETSNWRNEKLLSANFTRFDYVSDPPLKPYPEKTQMVRLKAPAVSFTNAVVSSNSIVKDSRYADEATYKFEKGNLVETTTRAGVTTSYIWGYNNTLPIIKATGINHATLQDVFTTVGEEATLLREESTMKTSFIQSYEYKPLVGLTRETDANGHNTSYLYDGYGRLSVVTDNEGHVVKKMCYTYAGQPRSCIID